MLKTILLFLCLQLFNVSALFSQTFSEGNAGATIGINLAIGNPINRIGLSFSAFYLYEHLQINFNSQAFHNFTSMGPKVSSNEAKFTLGIIGAFGSSKSEVSEFLNPISNQSSYAFSMGYAYSIILASNGTSQPMGMIGVNYEGLMMVHENDILAGRGDDKFRTGGLLVSYEENNRRFGLNYMGWTGDPRSTGALKVKDSDYPAKHGYKDLRNATFGRFSHGVLAVEVAQLIDYGQVVRLQAGLDAEQIRNSMQNKLMHEQITGGYHYPMLQENGDPYLFNEGENVRRVKSYFELMLNPSLFY